MSSNWTVPSSVRLWPALALAAGLVASATPAGAQDSDGDSIADASDAFPCDASFAGVTFAPGEGAHGGLLFEDQWPQQGDLDFNDVALTYNYVLYLDAQAKVVQIDATISALAVGGQLTHGLALALPVPASAAGTITRSVDHQLAQLLTPSATDTNLTVVLSDDLRELFGDATGPVNSDPSQARIGSVVLEASIMFSTPVTLSASEAPFDLFVFRSDDPGHEIHRTGYSGNSRMNVSLFGTGQDGSDGTRNFVDISGLPFVLEFPDAVPYPAEGVAVSNLFPNVATFAASGGTQAADFYTAPVTSHAYADVSGQGPLGAHALSPLSIDQSCVPVVQSTLTFDYTGASQSWVVPSGVSSVRIEAWGASGGNGRNGATGGLGAYIAGDISVTPGETLNVVVGQAGGNGTGSTVAGGGGGGGSFISRNGTPLIVAGGGGGGSYQAPGNTHGQPGLTTQAGGAGGYHAVSVGAGGYADNGNGGGCGAGGGGWNGNGTSNSWVTGGLSKGGAGGNGYGSYGGFGGFGGGGGSMHGGGGGGGYTGGSGGIYTVGGGGGGSYNAGANPSAQSGVRSGNGRVVFTVSGGGSTPAPTPEPDPTPTPTPTPSTGSQTFAYTGAAQSFTVPSGVTVLRIEAAGAQGGNGRNGATGGRGAFIAGDVAVSPGQVLTVVVGQAGGNGTGSSVAGGGGGGGSFVYAGSSPLMVAGGGGGGSYQAPGNTHGQPGLTTQAGGAGGYHAVSIGAGGYADNGNGGGCGAGGGGWSGNGTSNSWVTGGQSQGGAGGNGYGSYGGYGGFGGGGGSMHGGGGGGGYTGGSGGIYTVGGGGGGSYNAGSNVVETAGTNSGHGQVVVIW